MLSMLRSSDMLARLGGDEFGLLLPDCNIESARFISGRIISAINDYHFMWDGRLHRIGASAGITLIDDKTMLRLTSCLRRISPATRRKTADVGVSASMNHSKAAHAARSQLSLDEQKHTITHSPMLMIARGVASPRIPETFSFWLISLRLGTAEGEVIEEQTFRTGLVDPTLNQALDRRVFSEFFQNAAPAVASKGLSVALPFPPPGCSIQNLLMSCWNNCNIARYRHGCCT